MAKLFEGSFNQKDSDLFKIVFVELFAPLLASQNVLADALEKTVPGSANDKARTAQFWDAYEQAGLLLYSAEDHLRAILMLFEGRRLPTYALYTLLRAAAVAVVQAAYLLEGDIDETARIARGLNVRWENLDEQNKLEPDAKLFMQRVAELDERAGRRGITILRKNPDRPERDYGERRLSEFALFGRYLKSDAKRRVTDNSPDFGGMIYRFLSGHVHSAIWVKIVNAHVAETNEPGIASVKLDLRFDWFATMLLMVLRLHVENIKSLLNLSGYPSLVWESAMQTATERAKARYVELAEDQAAEEAAKKLSTSQ